MIRHIALILSCAAFAIWLWVALLLAVERIIGQQHAWHDVLGVCSMAILLAVVLTDENKEAH